LSRDSARQAFALRTTEIIGQRLLVPSLIVVASGLWLVLRHDDLYDFAAIDLLLRWSVVVVVVVRPT